MSVTTTHLPLSAIHEPSQRLRETIDVERLGELADSMAAEGLHQPIGVRELTAAKSYEIIWGHRRYLAARLLKWAEIEAKVFPKHYDPLLAASSENLQREDLTPMDEARLVARWVERGEPDAAIARLSRRSAQWVRERRELLGLPPDLQEAIHTRTLPMGVARVLGDIDHPEYRQELVAEAQRTGASVRVTEVWRAHYLADRERIISNHLVVAEIAARREAWKIMIACDLCGEDQEYTSTRSLRACQPCLAAVAALMERAAADADPKHGPRTTQQV
jgi:ParB family chromosome partitioning protein